MTLQRASAALTVDMAVRQRAMNYPARTALVQDGRRISYGELQQRVDRLCHALERLGVRHGDRIAMLSENRFEYAELLLAAANMGAIVACQNWRQSDAELQHCLGMVEPRLIITSPRFAHRLAVVAPHVNHVVTLGDEYERLIEREDNRRFESRSRPEDILIILYTSGTTGYPKGAAISHRAEMARAMISAVDGQIPAGRGTIVWSPLFHMGGTDPLLAVLMNGDTVFIVDGFQSTLLLEIMSQEVLGNVTLMPASIGRVIEELHRTGLRPKSLKLCGAMPDLVPRHQIAEITTLLNAEFRNTFGSTETGGPPASRHTIPIGAVPDRLSKTQSAYCHIRLVDEDDQDVEAGTPGEVLMRGPSLFSGYWNAPDINAHEFRGGWFHMGDLLVRNPDGSLDFVDRRKYLIKSGGENIYPAEIERVLLESRRIADAVIVRKHDAHWGEVPVAFVVRADATLTADEVVALCRGRIANYKLPKEVHFIAEAEMPRSETSKVKRFELEARLKGVATAE
ncbi:long-chain fatty acid--CoA ligase [soil metagenome]